MSYGHAFTDWWEKYGKEHPEWFQLVNGKRGPTKPGARYAMCVSNPELHREIVARWRARGGAEPGKGPSFLNVVENDILGMCECERCRAWDGPEPADAMKFYSPNFKVYGSRFMSDRYARFELAVQQLAAKENPNVSVIGYVYFNYFQAPTSGVKLNSNILLGYCPSAGWYPRADDEHDWYKQQWKGWRDTGARLFARTNYFLDGYCMPFIFAHQFADDFQHQVRNGMVATDFDSLTGQWGTQGPNLYLLLRLHTRPEAKPDELLAEYYSAFGPAAKDVKEISPAMLEGFAAAKVLVEGLRRAGSNPTRAKVLAALEATKKFDIGGMDITYGPDDHTGLDFVDLSIIGKDGKFRR